MPPPRGSQGMDFRPILTHFLFLGTFIFALAGWLTAFIAQAAATSHFGHGVVGVLWFAIFLQLAVILGVLYTLATDQLAMHRLQISVFTAVALVFSVTGVNQGIFSGASSLEAMGAGYLLLSFVNILWTLYFTSEEDALFFHVWNSLGTGGLTPPSRSRRRTQPVRSSSMMGGGPVGGGNGYSYPGGGIGSGPGMGIGGGNRNSVREMGDPSREALGNTGAVGGGNPATPLMGGGAGSVSSPGGGAGGGSAHLESGEDDGRRYAYKAKALYAYQASADDPNEISFTKGEILEIVDNQGKWWQARKPDGTEGIAPSNYLQII